MKNLRKMLINGCVWFVLIMITCSFSEVVEDVITTITWNINSMFGQVMALYGISLVLSAAGIYMKQLSRSIMQEAKVSYNKTKKNLQQKAVI